MLRRLYQDHLDLRASREQRLDEVIDAAGLPRPSVEAGHGRGLTTIFGPVVVTRFAYRRRASANLHPADAVLNLCLPSDIPTGCAAWRPPPTARGRGSGASDEAISL